MNTLAEIVNYQRRGINGVADHGTIADCINAQIADCKEAIRELAKMGNSEVLAQVIQELQTEILCWELILASLAKNTAIIAGRTILTVCLGTLDKLYTTRQDFNELINFLCFAQA